ncbi:MAG: phasin family protein [Lautropia sp.]
MFAVPEQFIAIQRQSLESARAVALASITGFEKFTQLNAQAAKASFEEGVEKTVALLDTRDVQAFAATLSDSSHPDADKFSAYAKHVYAIAQETGTEIQKVVEKHFAEGNRALSAAIESFAKNAPAGSEGVVTLVKSAVTAANSAWDQVNKATRQAVELTEANVASATDATRAASKRKAA